MVISLHGNSSCRLGALELVCPVLEAGFSLLAFDFSGSGLSEVRIHFAAAPRRAPPSGPRLFPASDTSASSNRGCSPGCAQGDYVTLGWQEHQDLGSVVDFMLQHHGVERCPHQTRLY